MRRISLLLSWWLLPLLAIVVVSCSRVKGEVEFTEAISEVIADAPGKVGVAVILDNVDTLTVNNDTTPYPLMSVFKLHQAVALGRELDRLDADFDSVIVVRNSELNPETWSPLFHERPTGDFELSLAAMMEYLLLYSDNNVSNILFNRFCAVERTDSIIRSLVLPPDFRLRHTEADMQSDHAKAYDNWSTPLSAAALINRVFTDSCLISSGKQDFIKSLLERCETGRGRIPAAFVGNDSVRIAHRTGSGYVNERGVIVAVNDVAYVMLPTGHSYAIAVLVKDFSGSQEEAEKLIANISSAVYAYEKSCRE